MAWPWPRPSSRRVACRHHGAGLSTFDTVVDPIELAVAVVQALHRPDAAHLHRLVPNRFWGWLDDFLDGPDGDGCLARFALDPEEFEGIGTIVIGCPDAMTAELRAFYASLVGPGRPRRPRLHFDEGGYRPPRWPDPQHPPDLRRPDRPPVLPLRR